MVNDTKPRKEKSARARKTKEQGEVSERSRSVDTRTAHEDTCTAHHEAGHMVMAYAVGMKVSYVSIERVVEAESEGAMTVEPGKTTYPHLLAFTLAGHAAEASVNKSHFVDHASDKDWQDAADRLSHLTGRPISTAEPYIWVLFEWTRRALAPARSRIKAVAEHLLRVRSLKGVAACRRVLAVDGRWKEELLAVLADPPASVPVGFRLPPSASRR